MKKMFSRPVFAGNLCLFAVLAAAVFFIGCEMDVSESPVLDEIEAAYRGLQAGGETPGDNTGSGGSENPSPGPDEPAGGVTPESPGGGTTPDAGGNTGSGGQAGGETPGGNTGSGGQTGGETSGGSTGSGGQTGGEAPGGNTGSGGQTGGETSGGNTGSGGSENPSPAPGHPAGSVFKSGGISYLVLSDGSLKITGIDSQIREVTVPGTVDGHPVRDIDAGIFRNNHNLVTADFSQADYLEKLGANLFGSADHMETADFSGCNSLVTVGAYAFENCHALRKADFPDCPALERIDDRAFQSCDRMETADFSGCTSLREIGNFAFGNCNNLKEVDLSGCPNLETIAQNAFENCSQLGILHLCGSTDNLLPCGIPDIRNSAVYVQDEEEISALPFPWQKQAEICPEHGVRRAR